MQHQYYSPDYNQNPPMQMNSFRFNHNQLNIRNNDLNFNTFNRNNYLNQNSTYLPTQSSQSPCSSLLSPISSSLQSPTSNTFQSSSQNYLYSPNLPNQSPIVYSNSNNLYLISNQINLNQRNNPNSKIRFNETEELQNFNFLNRNNIQSNKSISFNDSTYDHTNNFKNEKLNQKDNIFFKDQTSLNQLNLKDSSNLVSNQKVSYLTQTSLSQPSLSTNQSVSRPNSPLSLYVQPNLIENRNKKNEFNFKIKKFKIKGKKSASKQSKKNKREKSKSKPGLLYVKLDKGVSSGTLNSLNKMQLSILNTGLIRIESEKASEIIPKEPFDLSTTKYLDHLTLIRKYRFLLKVEFFVACKTEQHSFDQALKQENEYKNCNKKLLPYDYNRVVLDTIPDQQGSDYINASFVDSILKPNAYITTQGPSEETINDFWRMVWGEKSYIIVMLTKVFDFIRVMCTQYWPIEMNKAKLYGMIEVTLLTEEPLADFCIRTFRIRKLTQDQLEDNLCKDLNEKDDNLDEKKKDSKEIKENHFSRPFTPSYNTLHLANEEYRIVYQFHYEKWPTHSCPFGNSILQFRRRVRIFMEELEHEEKNIGPMIVHCSDGGGRTGTFLAIDANLEYSEEDNKYDVFNYTKRLRQLRRGLIDNVDQYKFVYNVLEEAYLSGKTWFPVSDLAVKMKFKSYRDSETKINEYQREYEKILKLTPKFSIGDCAGAHRIENRAKNRDVLLIPPDNHRPYLTTFQSNDSTDYVNAVFVDGYTREREYIVTEWPMSHTIPDCWSLIYDHDCNSVVILSNPEDESTFPKFWPEKKKEDRKYGPVFTVECMECYTYPNIKCWLFKIYKKVVSLTELMSGVKGIPKITQFFQITCWPAKYKVPSSTNALVELMNMVERWRQRTSYGPVVVISNNGKSRAGVYCAANVAIEQVVQHREVDVFTAVRIVRRHRSFLVENLMEYKYCYDLILHYVLNYLKPETK